MEVLDIEQGVARIFELLGLVSSKPIIIGIYGHKHAGKTYLAKRCLEESLSRGLKATGGRIESVQSYSSNTYPYPDVCFVDDYVLSSRRDSVKHAGKPIDITVLVRNYNLCDSAEIEYIEWLIGQGNYDLVIDNHISSRKTLKI